MQLMTYDEYRVFANLKKPEIEDEVKALIDAANAHVTAWLNIDEAATQIIQVTANRNTYFLEGITASGITYIRPMGATDDSYDLSPSSYFLQPPGILTFLSQPSPGYYTVAIEYPYTDPYTVDKDIKMAVYLLVVYWHKQEYRDSKSFGGETVAFTNQNTGMPKHIRTILELHRNI